MGKFAASIMLSVLLSGCSNSDSVGQGNQADSLANAGFEGNGDSAGQGNQADSMAGDGFKGNSDSAGQGNQADLITNAGFEMIKGSPVEYSALCDRIESVKMIDRIDRTAGQLNYPAHIIGYTFDCLSSVAGREHITMYIGFVVNNDKDKYECIHHNQNREPVESGGWYECGGLN